MDKELIDRVWKYYLPKEFKEEVKRHFFKKNAQSPFSIECDVLCKYFGHHNLTSDADGEEMLTVPRKDIIELYQEVQKTISQCKGTELAIQAIGIKNVIWSFFGSKCLPDGNEDNFATKEPKPAEPKFAKGDMIHCKSFGYEGDYKVLEYSGGPRNCYDCIDKYGAYYRFYESDLEPYTEPTDLDKSTSTCTDERKSQERLKIAAILAAGMLANDNNSYPIDRALELADALLVEAQKGGE